MFNNSIKKNVLPVYCNIVSNLSPKLYVTIQNIIQINPSIKLIHKEYQSNCNKIIEVFILFNVLAINKYVWSN